MEEANTLEIQPISGDGWVVEESARFPVPARFVMQVEYTDEGCWFGLILDDGHEFGGQRARVSRRHIPFTGYVNITIAPRDPSRKGSTGFGILSEFADNVSPPIKA